MNLFDGSQPSRIPSLDVQMDALHLKDGAGLRLQTTSVSGTAGELLILTG